MKLTITTLCREGVFCDDYQNLNENNVIDFSNKRISVIYGPNGTGKTSFALLLSMERGGKYSISIDGRKYTETDPKIAYVIKDQNDRNIIQGSTEDFIVGDNIKREYELKRNLENGFFKIFYEILPDELKNTFGISTKSSFFYKFINSQFIKQYISEIANKAQKGRSIDRKAFLENISRLEMIDVPTFDEDLFRYFVDDIKSKDSLLQAFYELQLESIIQEPHFIKIEETNDAIRIIEKYPHVNDCIVCDSAFEREKQLEKKRHLNKTAVESMSAQSKKIVEQIIKRQNVNDPFNIKSKMKSALMSGDFNEIHDIMNSLKLYEIVYDALITNLFIKCVNESGLIEIFEEYQKIILEKPEFEDEDVMFIENFLNESLDRKICLARDENKNLKLLLGDKEFLNLDRKNLQLSNGEQNFLSLSFELLKAKKESDEIIVLDDPVSSFDSIFKNKIAYAILKFLEKKKTIVLTHTLDLIKLLEHQHTNCFSLYYMNNTVGEENGFIYVNPKEIKLLLYTHEFLALLRQEIKSEILDERAYLISLVPFMRGYCQLLNKAEYKNKLTKVMHGYNNEQVNLTEIYTQLFSTSIISKKYIISALDIINSNTENLQIINNENFPLLSKTLNHTYMYLYLRLNVEKKLVDKYKINTKKNEMLSDIIIDAFKGGNNDDLKNRAFFLSRKTLLNEFNHFEMDMNIFQPAIDITNQVLNNEKIEIMKKLQAL